MCLGRNTEDGFSGSGRVQWKLQSYLPDPQWPGRAALPECTKFMHKGAFLLCVLNKERQTVKGAKFWILFWNSLLYCHFSLPVKRPALEPLNKCLKPKHFSRGFVMTVWRCKGGTSFVLHLSTVNIPLRHHAGLLSSTISNKQSGIFEFCRFGEKDKVHINRKKGRTEVMWFSQIDTGVCVGS